MKRNRSSPSPGSSDQFDNKKFRWNQNNQHFRQRPNQVQGFRSVFSGPSPKQKNQQVRQRPNQVQGFQSFFSGPDAFRARLGQQGFADDVPFEEPGPSWAGQNRNYKSSKSRQNGARVREPSPEVQIISQHQSRDNRQTPSAHIYAFNDVYETLITPSDADGLSKGLWSHYRQKSQNEKVYKKKVRLWAKVDEFLRMEYRNCRTHAFGSTLSGFGGNSSDLDLCVFPGEAVLGSLKGKNKNKRDLQFLYNLRRQLRHRLRGLTTDQDIEVIPAKVPLMKFHDREYGFEVDLTCGIDQGPRNTHLLYCYSRLDPRVRPLVLAVKAWAKAHDINEAKFATLSSYTLTLMVIHYLQCGAHPAVLPCLQKECPDLFNTDRNIFDLQFQHPLPQFKSDNTESLGSLFKGFFQYYHDDFDFTRDCASVRAGQVLNIRDCEAYAKENSLTPGQWSAYVCVEEPCDRTNAGRAVVKRDAFECILDAFKYTCYELGRRKGPRLNRLLEKPDD